MNVWVLMAGEWVRTGRSTVGSALVVTACFPASDGSKQSVCLDSCRAAVSVDDSATAADGKVSGI